MELTLKKRETEVLRVNIGDEVVNIPLGSSLTIDEFAELATFEGTVKFYNKYIPPKIAKTLTISEYNQITEAWLEATRKETKLPVGE